ncbi:HET-domain-containing protein, partial [Cenococcum geophilum 1.58]
MRLLNTTSLELKDFIGSNIPPYVILSHTWSDEEVLFDDIQKGTAALKKGHAKLKGCCQKGAEDGFDWAWIDTCCIDKSSSAELSEAINSMYEWYKKSTICYAYLQDVSTNALSSSNPSFTRPQDFSKSRWFTRGWTLQELVASKVVEFYTAEWVEIGTKRSLLTQLSAITGIPPHILRGGSPSTCNIAERMSWASKRQTSREEDLAYCLLGLFNVNMPMLYGEGKKAFYRLQEQIMNQEEDYSIFAWSLQYDCGPSLTGLLASSPVEFSKTAPSGLQLPTLQHLLFPKAPGEASDAFNNQLLAPHIWGHNPWGPDKLTQINMRDFYATGSWYRVLHDKEYESLNTHIPHQHLSASGTTPSQDQAPWKPPQLTSRGLRVSLPIRKPNDPTLPSVAWIYCKFGLEARLLCILLQHLSPSSQLLGRHSASWLISVDASIIKEFVLTELYLH